MVTHSNYIHIILFFLLTATEVCGQTLHEEYIDWESQEDVNFFISRVAPRLCFRDVNTQVRQDLDAENDKSLCMWMPLGSTPFNALPDAAFDRDVFSMWHYVTHFGNWSAPLAKIPGAALDVAHRNGVGISATANIPMGTLNETWRNRLYELIGGNPNDGEIDLKASAERFAEYLNQYGIDGIGYNSEFNCEPELIGAMSLWHEHLRKAMRKSNPLAEVIWYDGTNEMGNVTYDNGLATHNDDIFGCEGHERTNLFLNYNWNNDLLLSITEEKCTQMKRNPHDIYCGFNLQGREPRDAPKWTLLAKTPFSIGLWGAHSENMFYESRAEQGYADIQKQQTYLTRQEMWFTGGSRSVIGNHDITESLRYDTDNTSFHGMSAFMSARSALSWNLDNEPFVTCFNIGNGLFFNWKGETVSHDEWYNIGMQDHLPTWRWWIAPTLLSRDMSTPIDGRLTAQLSWEDAYMGGSSLEIKANNIIDERYLHLFKTHFLTNADDMITLTAKVCGGSGKISLVLMDYNGITTERELPLDYSNTSEWQTITLPASMNSIALIALKVSETEDMLVRLGRLALTRHNTATPQKPRIDTARLLAQHKNGADGKLIFSTNGRYNLDSETAFFRLYSEDEEGNIKSHGATTSWAAILFSIKPNTSGCKVRMGVSAVGLDMLSESETTWSEWLDTTDLPLAPAQPDMDATDKQQDVYDETTGHAPHIESMEITKENMKAMVTAKADYGYGTASRALSLNEKAFGFRASDLRNIDNAFFNKSFSISFRIKVNAYHADTQLLSIRDKTDYWPYTDWGWFWHTVSKDGRSSRMTLRRKTSFGEDINFELPDFQLTTGRWHHLTYIFDLTNEHSNVWVYLDGKLMSKGNTSGTSYPQTSLLGFRQKNIVAIGGSNHSAGGIDGDIDDVRIWDRDLSGEEVLEADDYLAEWNFEDEADENDCWGEDIPAFLHRYVPGEREGEGTLIILKPEEMSIGAPDAIGDAWKNNTSAKWMITPEAVIEKENNESVTVVFPHAGTYSISLTLSNHWGEDIYTLSNINVDDNTRIINTSDTNKNILIYDTLGRKISPHQLRRGERYKVVFKSY